MDMFKLLSVKEGCERLGLERSTSPDATMNLLLRFETASGPRTVIACSVPLATARDIVDTMRSAGQHAEFVDRCAPLSVADRVMIEKFKNTPLQGAGLLAFKKGTARKRDMPRHVALSAFHVAAE